MGIVTSLKNVTNFGTKRCYWFGEWIKYSLDLSNNREVKSLQNNWSCVISCVWVTGGTDHVVVLVRCAAVLKNLNVVLNSSFLATSISLVKSVSVNKDVCLITEDLNRLTLFKNLQTRPKRIIKEILYIPVLFNKILYILVWQTKNDWL